ncbi:MAG: PAS domain-containing protein [Cytophagales bacterium]|nr:PAS domain-containing protein [Cytophagales bacterium]
MEESSETLLHTLPVAIVRHDGDGVITFVNAAFERETGLPAATVLGRPVPGLPSFDGAGAWYDALRAVLGTGSAGAAEVRCGDPSALRHYAVEVVPETTSDGRPPTGALSVLRNLSDLRQSQADLHQSRLLMEKQQAELAKVSGHLETFVYTAAHDLRAPVANLLVLTKLLMGHPEPAQRETLLETAQQSVAQLDRTIKGLVEVLEVQSTFHVTVQPVTLESILAGVRKELAADPAGSALTVAADFAACPRVSYIRAYLESIFRNLLGNAAKYRSEDRPPAIAVASGREGAFVTLAFADNGVGIDLARQGHKLFRPFSRLTTRGDGKGLGLYLVKNMVEKNGGKIRFDSTVGRGTTVTCYLVEYTSNQT